MYRLLPIVCMVAASLLLGCYDRLETPTSPPSAAEPDPSGPPADPSEPPAERPVQPSVAGTGNLAGNLSALDGVINKLGRGSASRAPEDRPGSARWRPAELEKLAEITGTICSSGSAGCRDALERLAGADLPADELRAVLAIFLGPLRLFAEVGFSTLGAHLLTGSDAVQRDMTFRMAVAAGVTRRGDPDVEGRRATLLPQSPAAESPAVLVVELPSPCPKILTELKGPDVNGRIDLDIRSACEGEADPEPTADGFPRPARAVWGLAFPSMPSTGLSLWAFGGTEPLLDYSPPPEDKGKEAGR